MDRAGLGPVIPLGNLAVRFARASDSVDCRTRFQENVHETCFPGPPIVRYSIMYREQGRSGSGCRLTRTEREDYLWDGGIRS